MNIMKVRLHQGGMIDKMNFFQHRDEYDLIHISNGFAFVLDDTNIVRSVPLTTVEVLDFEAKKEIFLLKDYLKAKESKKPVEKESKKPTAKKDGKSTEKKEPEVE